jgi:hypothetical protein
MGKRGHPLEMGHMVVPAHAHGQATLRVDLSAGEREMRVKPEWLRAGDVYQEALALCQACGRADPRAREEFLRDYSRTLREAIARVQDGEEFVADVFEQLISELFAPEQPTVLQYDGSDSLRTWLRIRATRLAFERLRALSSPFIRAKA